MVPFLPPAATATTPHELAHLYNTAPRNAKTPSGLCDNFWAVSVRLVPLFPPGLVVILVNPQSRYIHAEKLPDSIAVSDQSRPERLAVPVALAVMKAFSEGLMSHTPRTPQERATPFAPWQLGMEEGDMELAKQVERQLRGLKVEKERRRFRAITSEEAGVAHQVWLDLLETLTNAVRGEQVPIPEDRSGSVGAATLGKPF